MLGLFQAGGRFPRHGDAMSDLSTLCGQQRTSLSSRVRPLLADIVEKVKIERRQKSRKCRFLDDSAVGVRRSVDTKVRGRSSAI